MRFKRFILLFTKYKEGGLADASATSDDFSKVKAEAERLGDGWCEILDTQEGVVYTSSGKPLREYLVSDLDRGRRAGNVTDYSDIEVRSLDTAPAGSTRGLLAEAVALIKGMAEQQAMPDDAHEAFLERVRELSS